MRHVEIAGFVLFVVSIAALAVGMVWIFAEGQQKPTLPLPPPSSQQRAPRAGSLPSRRRTSAVGVEELVYEFGWAGVAGARFSIEITTLAGSSDPRRVLFYGGRTLEPVSWLWAFSTRGVSYFDSPNSLPSLSLRFSREGGERKSVVLHFDRSLGLVRRILCEPDDDEYSATRVPLSGGMDTVGAFLKLRSLEWSTEEKKHMEVVTDDDVYKVVLTPLRKETLQVRAGKFEAVAVGLNLQKPGEEENEELQEKYKEMVFWVSEGPPHVPLRLESKVFVGHVYAELIRFQPGPRQLWASSERR